jgi:GTP cyclohydrolase I
METTELSWKDVKERAIKIAEEIKFGYIKEKNKLFKIYGIPRGGIFAAQAVVTELERMHIPSILTTNIEDSRVFIDDIIDSGETRDNFEQRPFYALVDKQGADKDIGWVVFPWEIINNEIGPEENVKRLLEYIGENPKREGLKETPKRVVKSFQTLYGGYTMKLSDYKKMFEKEDNDEMVVLKNIEVYSTCEHHMLPFFGKVHIAYIPKDKIIGVSKLCRIMEMYSRRLQIQERLCTQITKAVDMLIQPMGSACVIEAQHFCMTSRGVKKQNSIMVTSSLTGVFREDSKARSEFMSMIK